MKNSLGGLMITGLRTLILLLILISRQQFIHLLHKLDLKDVNPEKIRQINHQPMWIKIKTLRI